MKYVIVLGDGMADERYEQLGGRTPLEAANAPVAAELARKGEVGLVQSVPAGMKPGSDVANLAVMGYDPRACYSGRSPLEAVSIGVELDETDVTYRCNLVTLSNEPDFAEKTMLDYSSGEITTPESRELVTFLAKNLKLPKGVDLFPGVSYRHCLRWRGGTPHVTELTPPHDISDRKIAPYLPKGGQSEVLFDLMRQSERLLKDHPINQRRMQAGKNPATSCWFWGEGTKPAIPSFEAENGVRGAVISAVDLIKGIGILAGMKSIDVEGATGNIRTNFDGKAAAAIDAIRGGYDFVYIHLEAPDECGHQGQLAEKVRSIELIDEKVTKPVFEALKASGEPFAILFVPDHPTPVRLKTHTGDAVPYVMYKSEHELDGTFPYSEAGALASGNYVSSGRALMKKFLKRD